MNTINTFLRKRSAANRPWTRLAMALSITTATAFATPMVHAADLDLAGVKVEQSINLAGKTLQLNGAGIRYRGPFKVYTAALYTTQKVSTAAAFHADTGGKQLVLTMLREIKSSEMGSLFMKGVQSNLSSSELGQVIGELPRMGEIFSANKRLMPDDQLVIEWVPGRGMLISARGVPQGEPFVSRVFFSAMMNIWLGTTPADWQLKEALLGSEQATGSNRR